MVHNYEGTGYQSYVPQDTMDQNRLGRRVAQTRQDVPLSTHAKLADMPLHSPVRPSNLMGKRSPLPHDFKTVKLPDASLFFDSSSHSSARPERRTTYGNLSRTALLARPYNQPAASLAPDELADALRDNSHKSPVAKASPRSGATIRLNAKLSQFMERREPNLFITLTDYDPSLKSVKDCIFTYDSRSVVISSRSISKVNRVDARDEVSFTLCLKRFESIEYLKPDQSSVKCANVSFALQTDSQIIVDYFQHLCEKFKGSRSTASEDYATLEPDSEAQTSASPRTGRMVRDANGTLVRNTPKRLKLFKPRIKFNGLEYRSKLDNRTMTITDNDFQRLYPGQMLNDTLIMFGLRLAIEKAYFSNKKERAHDKSEELQRQSRSGSVDSSIEVTNEFLLLDTFFVTKLVEGGYEAVRKWTDRTDIFLKKMIIVPIHYAAHWYVAVIYNPSKILEQSDSTLIETAAGEKLVPIEDDVNILDKRDENSKPQLFSLDKINKRIEQIRAASASPAAADLEMEPLSDDLVEKVPANDAYPDSNGEATAANGHASDDNGSESNLKVTAGSSTPHPEVDYLDDATCIFVFDSMAKSQKMQVVEDLKQYLANEAKNRKGIDIDTNQIKAYKCYNPQQTNYYDCGVHLIHCIDVFLSNYREMIPLLRYPRPKYSILRKFWQAKGLAKRQREELKNLLLKLAGQENVGGDFVAAEGDDSSLETETHISVPVATDDNDDDDDDEPLEVLEVKTVLSPK